MIRRVVDVGIEVSHHYQLGSEDILVQEYGYFREECLHWSRRGPIDDDHCPSRLGTTGDMSHHVLKGVTSFYLLHINLETTPVD